MLRRRFFWLTMVATASAAQFFACGGSQSDSGTDPDGSSDDAPELGFDGSLDGTVAVDGGSADASSTDSGATDSSTDVAIDAAPVCNQLPCAVQISAKGRFACALLSDQTVSCWGDDVRGELGAIDDSGTFDASPRSTPQRIAPLPPSTKIVAADWVNSSDPFACAIEAVTGRVFCWGSDNYGRLGGGPDVEKNSDPVPAPVVNLASVNVLALGAAHGCAIRGDDGGFACWGLNNDYQLGYDAGNSAYPRAPDYTFTPDLVDVAAGGRFTCGIHSDRTVTCWGEDVFYQAAQRDSGSPASPARIPALTNVAEISAGQHFACARTFAGQVLCWGLNSSGQLGRPDSGLAPSPDPLPAALPAGSVATMVTTGTDHACAGLSDNSVWCWGSNLSGSLGVSDAGALSAVPVQVTGLPGKVLGLAAGETHTCALIEGGTVWCWGGNVKGELGRGSGDGGDPDNASHPIPAKVQLY